MCCEMRALNVISPVVRRRAQHPRIPIASYSWATLMTTQLDGGPAIDVYK
jgi:hypothetical protein